MKVFISRHKKGWAEVDLPPEMKTYSYERLLAEIHSLIHCSDYKGLLITENPHPFSEFG